MGTELQLHVRWNLDIVTEEKKHLEEMRMIRLTNKLSCIELRQSRTLGRSGINKQTATVSSSSSDRVDSRGPLCQPRLATMTSLGPFSTNAEGCTIADLLDP